jgi:hypothetical protein
MEPRPTLENGCEGASFDIEIYSFLKIVRLMRLRAAPSSTRTWYNLMLVMVEETRSVSYSAPALFLGQLEASKMIDVSIHLWWGTALVVGAAAATARSRVLMAHWDMMFQEPPYMTWSALLLSLMLESELEWS